MKGFGGVFLVSTMGCKGLMSNMWLASSQITQKGGSVGSDYKNLQSLQNETASKDGQKFQLPANMPISEEKAPAFIHSLILCYQFLNP